jgi:hypothetical protein
MKIRSGVAEFVSCGRDGWTNVTELLVTFRSFAKAPKNENNEKLETRPNTEVFNRTGTEKLRERD